MYGYIQLNDTERNRLLTILEERLESLCDEIQHTDSRDYRRGLEADRASLESLILKVRSEGDETISAAV